MEILKLLTHRFICSLAKFLGQAFPKKIIKICYKNRLPYLTKALRKSIDKKHILKYVYQKNTTVENKLLCTTFNNKLTSLLRIREKEYIEEQLELNKTDLPRTWKIIKDIVGKTKIQNNIKQKMYINGELTSDIDIIYNAFNNYFVTIGPQLANKININKNPLTYINSTMNSIFIPYINEKDITQVVNSLKNSSAGWDFIPASIAKQSIQSYIKPLTGLINSSFQNGIFPDELKIAKVIPIFKDGDKTDIANYRPISVLSFFSKIFEKIMYNCLINFIEEHNIIYKFQFGFRKSHSTSHAIISMVEQINNALDSGNIIGVFLDLKKAFDTVNHKIILDKLFRYGIRGKSLNWFKSYLTNRKQFVNFQGTESLSEYVTCGVPQGSILGPLLFIIYINDLPNVTNKLVPILFADDTTLLIEGSNIHDIITTLNNELNSLNVWLGANKLSINVSKTHYMVCHRARRKDNNHNNIFLNNYILTKVNYTKLLGIILDNKLNWINHISYIKNKIAKGIGILLKARKVLNKKFYSNYITHLFSHILFIVLKYGALLLTFIYSHSLSYKIKLFE